MYIKTYFIFGNLNSCFLAVSNENILYHYLFAHLSFTGGGSKDTDNFYQEFTRNSIGQIIAAVDMELPARWGRGGCSEGGGKD